LNLEDQKKSKVKRSNLPAKTGNHILREKGYWVRGKLPEAGGRK